MAERRYTAAGIAVRWRAERCIHSEECVRSLPGVFDTARRPWIDPEAAEADTLAAVIERCPSGALAYERLDGAAQEEPEGPTRIVPSADGPLQVRGDLRVRTPDGELVETRATLCRCGQSANKPFCDNSHRKCDFRPEAPQPVGDRAGAAVAGPTTIVPTEDGPLRISGDLRVESATGEPLGEAGELKLCRCGRSGSKPYCDGSHKTA